LRKVLFEHLKQQTQSASPEISVDTVQGVDVEAIADNPVQPESVKARAVQTEVIEQLERHKKRDINYKYITIPIGVAFAILAFVRTCGEDMIREQRSEEHTSELQSRFDLVCRLLLEKKKQIS